MPNNLSKDLTRRDAVKTTAAAAVAATSLITGAPWIQKVKGANSKISYGFIGAGTDPD